MYSEVGEALGGIAINLDARRDADLDILELLALRLARVANALDAFVGAFEVEREAVPSLREARGAAVGLFGMAAEDDLGMRFLHRTRHRVDALEFDPLPAELGFRHRPQREHRFEVLLGARTLMVEWRADRIELRLEVADADAENQPPIR